MGLHFKTYYSNRAEILYGYFKEALFKGTHPLSKRIVIVPSRAMKSWLTFQLASDKGIGIAAGMEIGLMEPLLKKITQATSKDGKAITGPSEIELTLALEHTIRSLIYQKNPEKNYLPLLKYIGFNGGFGDEVKSRILSKSRQRRIISLSSVLAKTFIEYGIYGRRMIDSWNFQKTDLDSNTDLDSHNWQKLLWYEMEKMFFPWNYPAKSLFNFKVKDTIKRDSLQIHVFALSYLPPIILQFLENVSKAVPVHFYQLSPCQKFWGDLLTQKESSKWLNILNSKYSKTASSACKALEEYIQDSCPLLANFGKLGREMANVMEGITPLCSIESYSLPETISHYPQYEELLSDEVIFEKTKSPLTLLEAIQADMALLKGDGEKTFIAFDSFDFSIQVHKAPKPRREVEVIYDALLKVLSSSGKTQNNSYEILPKDILVMAPNIKTYLPFIREVFQKGSVPLDVQLIEPKSLMELEVVQGFMHLLKMAKGRFLASQFIELLSFTSFSKKQNIDFEEAKTIEKWIRQARVFWGKDAAHRNEVLSREYSFKQNPYEQEKTVPSENLCDGSWEAGFQHLLDGLIFNSKELLESASHNAAFSDINPFDGIEFSESVLLSKLIRLNASLLEDFRPLSNGMKFSLMEWIDYLKCILETYFSKIEEEGEKGGFQQLFDNLSALKSKSVLLNESEFSFEAIYSALEITLKKESLNYKESNLNTVKFSSLLPMRTVPAKVVVLLGLGDGLFPLETKAKSWNLLFGSPLADYCPDTADFDRFLFLEAILSARKNLILSYTSQEPGNIKELEPSQLVKELLVYLDQNFSIDQKKPSELCLFKHPLDGFDSQYYRQETGIKSYSLKNYKIARSELLEEKKKPYSFIESFQPLPLQGPSVTLENEITLELSSLLKFSKNPLKAFLNQKGICIPNDERSVQDDAELFLNNLNSWSLVKDSLLGTLTDSLDALIPRASKKGMLSSGPFLSVGKTKLKEEIFNLEKHLKSLGIKKGEVVSLKFNETKMMDLDEQTPPLILHSQKYGRIKLGGKLDFVSSQGVIFLVKDTLKKALELWPALLAYGCLIDQHKLPFQKNALFIKGKECKLKPIGFDCEKELTCFIEYYLSSQNTPTPLSPDFVERLLNKKMSEQMPEEDPNTPSNVGDWTFQDSYAKWRQVNCKDIEMSSSSKYWEDTGIHLYSALCSNWYERTGAKSEDV